MENHVFSLWRWEYLWKDRVIFAKGFLTTIEVAIGGLILAITIGFVIGVLATSKKKWVRVIARIYLELFRNIPLPLEILFMYYALVYGGIQVSKNIVGIVGLGLCIGAYISEIVRGGLEAVPRGQYEAAYSQGVGYFNTMRLVIFPQMIKIILPALTTQLVTLILNTSVMSMIAGTDLLYTTSNWAGNGTMSYGPAYLVCGILFFICCYPITRVARKYENKVKLYKR